MHTLSYGLIAALASFAQADPGPLDHAFNLRALPDSPSGGYAPQVASCPKDRPTVRLAEQLSDEEASWASRRRQKSFDPMRRLIRQANITDFDAESYFYDVRDDLTALPNIGLAFSGGGYRALLNGAGFLTAADSRNDANGPISGLLQSSTYVAGLSGGGWLVGSMFANNFSTIPDMQYQQDSGLWSFEQVPLVNPDDGWFHLNDLFDDYGYWSDIAEDLRAKSNQWNTSATDLMGRLISHQLIDAEHGGQAYTFSSIADSESFREADTPLPILVAVGRMPDELVISLNSTVYEFTPFELGSWDPTTFGFAPLKWLGSGFANGSVPRDEHCVLGFDQFGFVMATTSSLFNKIIDYLDEYKGSFLFSDWIIERIGKPFLRNFEEWKTNVARYEPNPFFGWDPTSQNYNSEEEQLTLVDGGEDHQNIPFHPLIQPSREVDIIFAVDSSADTDGNWPNGTALRATYDRYTSGIGNGTLFPPVPSESTFINKELNLHPTLFGCDADNFTLSDGQTVPPLVFYIPNAPYTYNSNLSTISDIEIEDDERDAVILNGMNIATQGNGTVDAMWPTCVACAILSRNWWKAGEDPPKDCKKCFEKYCWDGTTDDSTSKDYDPSRIIPEKKQESDDGGLFGIFGDWFR